MSEKILTTKEIMEHEFWPKLKQVIDGAISDFKKVYPMDKVELIDKGTCWHIELNGVPVEEIDCVHLAKTL